MTSRYRSEIQNGGHTLHSGVFRAWAYFKPYCVLSTKCITLNYSCLLSKKARRHNQTVCTTSFKITTFKTARSPTAKTSFFKKFFKKLVLAVGEQHFRNDTMLNVFVWTGKNDSETLRIDVEKNEKKVALTKPKRIRVNGDGV